MDSLKPQLPKINNEDRTPLVDVLLELLAWQQIQIDKLEQEILKLKGETTKPKIKPSKMDEGSAENGDENGDNGDKSKKNKGPKRCKSEHLRRIITEGALMGGLLAKGIPASLSIISDDAGQFNVFDHALCWIHAERIINRLIPLNAEHVKAVDNTREQLWQIYRNLKAYKLEPTAIQAEEIKSQFKTMCGAKTAYVTLNLALQRMGNNQHELLRVLDKPYLPLHNNLSERDIRDYVKKRKISGSTRSEAGRRCRDTFASLKKTCLKHKISFWHYLKDRLLGESNIPPLPDLIRAAATCG